MMPMQQGGSMMHNMMGAVGAHSGQQMATVHHHMHHGLPAGGMIMGAAQALGNH